MSAAWRRLGAVVALSAAFGALAFTPAHRENLNSAAAAREQVRTLESLQPATAGQVRRLRARFAAGAELPKIVENSARAAGMRVTSARTQSEPASANTPAGAVRLLATTHTVTLAGSSQQLAATLELLARATAVIAVSDVTQNSADSWDLTLAAYTAQETR